MRNVPVGIKEINPPMSDSSELHGREDMNFIAFKGRHNIVILLAINQLLEFFVFIIIPNVFEFRSLCSEQVNCVLKQ